jgi:stalled ribosome alternative rescue factor ArfA
MPLKKGKKNISSNIEELMDTYDKKGKIGTSKPKNKKKAAKQAAAIAYSKAEEDNESVAKKMKKGNGKATFKVKAAKTRKKPLPPTQVHDKKKGKGSYNRKAKNKTSVEQLNDDKGVFSEDQEISLFIKCILEKKYNDANKYLTGILNSKMQARISDELNTPLF